MASNEINNFKLPSTAQPGVSKPGVKPEVKSAAPTPSFGIGGLKAPGIDNAISISSASIFPPSTADTFQKTTFNFVDLEKHPRFGAIAASMGQLQELTNKGKDVISQDFPNLSPGTSGKLATLAAIRGIGSSAE